MADTFENGSEQQTLVGLEKGLQAAGYRINMKTRVLDVVRPAAKSPVSNVMPDVQNGLDTWLRMGRIYTGEFNQYHPWLEEGDWNYAFKAHFDFVVHAPMTEGGQLTPLFAVEFDGPSHSDTDVLIRDARKNRLCMASGLPLLRIDESFLHRRDKLSLVEWIAGCFADWRRDGPGLLAQRDIDLAELSDEEVGAAGPWLFCEYPHLDVEMRFRLDHKFPPTRTLAKRLGRKHGLDCAQHHVWATSPSWTLGWALPVFDPCFNPGGIETWTAGAGLIDSSGERRPLTGLWKARTMYPITADGAIPKLTEDHLLNYRPTALPGGLWPGLNKLIGHNMSLHNLLAEAETAITMGC